jgi:hypothetical protein
MEAQVEFVENRNGVTTISMEGETYTIHRLASDDPSQTRLVVQKEDGSTIYCTYDAKTDCLYDSEETTALLNIRGRNLSDKQHGGGFGSFLKKKLVSIDLRGNDEDVKKRRKRKKNFTQFLMLLLCAGVAV